MSPKGMTATEKAMEAFTRAANLARKSENELTMPGAGGEAVEKVWLRVKAMAESEGIGAEEVLVRFLTISHKQEAAMVDEALFEATEEKKLFAAYKNARTRIETLTELQDYVGVLEVVAEISTPIDAFFTAVMVMVDDEKVRNNRLALLRAITGLTTGIVDLSKIVPSAK